MTAIRQTSHRTSGLVADWMDGWVVAEQAGRLTTGWLAGLTGQERILKRSEDKILILP